MGVFVTGTDTGVGKTVVSCALLAVLQGTGATACKPVLTGLDDDGPHDHELLAAHTGQAPDDVAPERFGPAVSPHLAMELAGVTVDVEALLQRARGATVVEGAGGFLAPLVPGVLQRAFAQRLGFGVVIAARPGLGTINHTLLTIEAVRRAGLTVRAVVLGPWPDPPGPMLASNRETIAALGEVEVVTLGPVDAADGDALRAAVAGWDVAGWSAPATRPATALDHVVIAVSDWDRSNRFYAEVCGAELVRLDTHGPVRWRYRFGGQNLNVHGPGMDPHPVARIPAEPGMADLCLVWPGTAAEAVAHLRAHDVEVEDGPAPRHGAAGVGQSVYFRDPDGSMLELISYLG